MPLDDSQMDAVLHWINHQHGTSYLLRHRFPVGEEGAWLVDDPTGGSQLVLKLEVDLLDLDPLLVRLRTLDHLRSRGYPVPRYPRASTHLILFGDADPRVEHNDTWLLPLPRQDRLA
jgi:hypothetical protein